MNPKIYYPAKKFASDFWMFLEGNRTKFVFLLLMIFGAGFSGYISIYLLGKIVDFFIIYNVEDDLRDFYIYVAIIAVLGVVATLVRQSAKLSLLTLGAGLRRKSRIIALSKLVDLELKWHEKENTGSKIQKISGGSQNIYDALRMLSNEGATIITGIAGAATTFLFLDIKYGLFAGIYLILFLSIHAYFMKKKSIIQDQLSHISEKLSGKVHESASNILAVKSLGLKENIKSSLESHEDEYYRIWYKNRNLESLRSKTFNILASLGYSLFVLFIGLDAARGIIQAATIFVFASYFHRLREGTQVLMDSSDRFIEIKSGIGRIMSILDQKTIERESPHLAEVSPQWRRLDFANVCFKYKNRWVLKDFNLSIKRGENIGIVGRSGSGKSTLAKLILGLYEPQEGQILIDGKPLQEYKQSSINRQISIVLQESEMFNISLAENISISDEKPDVPKLAIAAKAAELENIIRKLPQGIKTLMGERGYKLSGGERQRVGIARAVYSRASMIILDEATSHLDSKTETQIQKNLGIVLKDKNIVVIAHRLSTLRALDRIIVMHAGKIVEEGTFEELVKKRGFFYGLYRAQRAH
ncbi:MAG TPA: ABC transporter ATP-binding protein [Candidatus Nanoarchaeia archaeon]|nr:ABC transporter ATP-binding protein [Candidatus Nanoarchaeia archaeon]